MEDKAQGGAPDSAADSQAKEIEFSDSSKKPDGSDEDPSESDGDEHEATQQQPRSLRQSDRVLVPPLRYD